MQTPNTAEDLPANSIPAPLGKRIMALLVDLSVITVASYVIAIVPLFAMASSAYVLNNFLNELTGMVLILVYLLVLLLIFSLTLHLYFIYFETKDGATPGKKIFGLSVLSENGQKITRNQAIKREILRTYIELPLILPALISILLSDKNQRLGDRFAKTIVVYSKNKEYQQDHPLPTAENKFKPAGFWIRFVAQMIDGLIISVIQYPIIIPFSVFTNQTWNPVTAFVTTVVSTLFSFLISFVYAGWFYTRRAATPGKMLFRIRVVDAETGNNLTWGQTFLREFIGKMASAIVLCIGYIMAGLRQDKKALHDLIAGTQCLRDTTPAKDVLD
ncbi:MAG: RDD family protein [Bdellovibrionota bacterium]